MSFILSYEHGWLISGRIHSMHTNTRAHYTHLHALASVYSWYLAIRTYTKATRSECCLQLYANEMTWMCYVRATICICILYMIGYDDKTQRNRPFISVTLALILSASVLKALRTHTHAHTVARRARVFLCTLLQCFCFGSRLMSRVNLIWLCTDCKQTASRSIFYEAKTARYTTLECRSSCSCLDPR